MTDTNIHHLKESANEVSAEISPQKKIASLMEAFKLFSQESSRLESSYSELKEHFNSLNTELHTTVEQLSQKLIELDAITYYLNSILSNISQGIFFIDLAGCVTTY